MNQKTIPAVLAFVFCIALLTTSEAQEHKFRIWKSKSEKFQVNAKLVERIDDQVRLQKENGSVITIDIDQLSKFDQKYLAKISRPVRRGPIKQPTKLSDFPISKSDVSAVTTVLADPEVDWKPGFDALPKIRIRSKPISIALKRDYECKKIFADANRQMMHCLLNHRNAKKDDIKYSIRPIDLSTGSRKPIMAFPCKSAIPADAGFGRVLSNSTGRSSSTVDIWESRRGKLEHLKGFEPYAHLNRGQERYMLWSRLLPDDRLITLNAHGRTIVWKASTGSAVFSFDLDAGTIPTLNPDRTRLIGASGGALTVLDLKNGKCVGKIPASAGEMKTFAVDQKQERIAGFGRNVLRIWNAKTGKEEFDFFLPIGSSLFSHAKIHWINRETILAIDSIQNVFLVDLNLKSIVWEYTSLNASNPVVDALGKTWYSHPAGNEIALFGRRFPDADARALIASIHPDKLSVLKPGISIALRVDAKLTADENLQVQQHLKKQLERSGFKVDPNANTILWATSRRGRSKGETYERIGGKNKGAKENVTVTETVMTLALVRNGNTVWQVDETTGGYAPWIIIVKEGESAQSKISKNEKAKSRFFLNQVIPGYISQQPELGVYGKSWFDDKGFRRMKLEKKK